MLESAPGSVTLSDMETNTYRNAVAGEILAWMGRRRMNRTALYRATGMSAMYLTRRLNGETAFDVDDLLKIAQVLDVPVTSLFPQTTDPAGGAATTHRYPQPLELADAA